MQSTVIPGVRLVNRPTVKKATPSKSDALQGDGPGTELSVMLAAIGITPPPGCACKERMKQMNGWGVLGCNEHFNEIIGWMRDGQNQWGWWEKIKAASMAVTSGLAFTLNMFDPFPGLVTEAIRRADEKEIEKKKQQQQKVVLQLNPVDADVIEPQLSVDWRAELGRGLSGRKFNASTIPWNGGYATAFRLVANGDDNVYVSIRDAELNELSYHRLEFNHRMASHRREDPRFFWHAGSWWISIIGVQAEVKWVANQLHAQLDPELRVVPGSVRCADYAARAFWEKNWGFFDHDGDLYAIYNIAPHTVLKIDGSNATEIDRHDWTPNWTGGLLRGGASPVLVGDEYYSFFHGRVAIRGVNYYATGCYTFAASPPFRPLRLTPKPFLVPPPDGWAKKNLSVLFTCGAFLQDGRWVLTHGVHDQFTKIDWIDAGEVERRLVAA